MLHSGFLGLCVPEQIYSTLPSVSFACHDSIEGAPSECPALLTALYKCFLLYFS